MPNLLLLDQVNIQEDGCVQNEEWVLVFEFQLIEFKKNIHLLHIFSLFTPLR